jgi:hypothetical protein
MKWKKMQEIKERMKERGTMKKNHLKCRVIMRCD